MRKLAALLCLLYGASARADLLIVYPGSASASPGSTPNPVVFRAPFTATGCFTSPTGSNGEAITVTRATTATLTVSGVLSTCTSGQLRVDANGALIEPAATNVLLRSGNIENAAWTDVNTSAASAASQTLPDGTTGGTKLQATAATNQWGRYQGFTYTAVPYTLSVYAKAGTYNCLALDFANTGGAGATFNLNTGAVGYSDAGVTASITAVGSWYRASITKTMSAGASFPEMYLSSSCSSNGRTAWAAAGTENLYVWGAQLETNTAATSYIATAGTTVTRNGDIVSSASSPVGPNAFSFSADLTATARTVDGTNTPYFLHAFNSASDRIEAYGSSGTTFNCEYYNGVQYVVTRSGLAAGAQHIMCKYDGATLTACIGSSCTSGAKVFVTTPPYTLYLGTTNGGGQNVQGGLANVCFSRTAGGCT